MAVWLRKTRSWVFWFHGSAAHAALTYMVIAQQQHNALAHLAAEFRLPVEEVQKRFRAWMSRRCLRVQACTRSLNRR